MVMKKKNVSFKWIKRVIFMFCFLQVLLAAVLVLAETQINFFRVAWRVLYFVFVLEAVLVTQGCFCSCWADLTLS